MLSKKIYNPILGGSYPYPLLSNSITIIYIYILYIIVVIVVKRKKALKINDLQTEILHIQCCSQSAVVQFGSADYYIDYYINKPLSAWVNREKAGNYYKRHAFSFNILCAAPYRRNFLIPAKIAIFMLGLGPFLPGIRGIFAGIHRYLCWECCRVNLAYCQDCVFPLPGRSVVYQKSSYENA